MNDDSKFMSIVFDLVEKAMPDNRGGPFGSLIVKDSKIISKGVNQVTSTNDPTAHSEIVAIREACKTLNSFDLKGCTLYTNCEPCPMCLCACYWARIDKLFFALEKKDAEKIGFDDAYFYEQICKPIPKRNLPMTQCMREEALTLFNQWEKKKDKIMY